MKNLTLYLTESKFQPVKEIESTSSNPPLEYKNYGVMKRLDYDDELFNKLGSKFELYYKKNKDEFNYFVFYFPSTNNKHNRVGLVSARPLKEDDSKYYLLIDATYDDFFKEVKTDMKKMLAFCKTNCNYYIKKNK